MTPETDLGRRAHAMLERAMEVEPATRRAFVNTHCAGEPSLARLVLELVDAADRSEHFLDVPALEVPGGACEIPDAVGDYLVVGVLGTGGMATVYEAIQSHPQRSVALKVMHQSVTDSEAYLRFQFETKALARLRHPGIAQIYEAGAARLGRPAPAPFFAMELVPDAAPITVYADRHGLTLRARLVMIASVCDAVHHGHQHGVIHRDLKPANVLVDGDGRAKVIDFGVARIADAGAESLTVQLGGPQLIGTLNYMSPEQYGAPGEVDIRSDVYSLGVMLYELVSGRLPYDLRNIPLPAALHAIAHEPPRRPELPNRRSHRDLEAIILKAIEKDPRRRYDSASALAADLRHFLAHRPIEARPLGLVDQFRLFSRRNRAMVASASAVLVSILIIAGISIAFAVRLAQEVKLRSDAETIATVERDAARWHAYTGNISGALAAMNTGEFEQMRARLAEGGHHAGGWEWKFLLRMAARSTSVIPAHDEMIMDVAVNPEWSRFVSASGNGELKLWKTSDDSMVAQHRLASGARIFSVAFTPDGQRVLCGDQEGNVRLFDHQLREIALLPRVPGEVHSVAALPGGRVAAAGPDGSLHILTLDPPAEVPFSPDQPGGVHGLKVSPDHTLLATFNDRGVVFIRRADDLSVLQRLEFPGVISHLQFTNDAARLAAVRPAGEIIVWNVADGSVALQLKATPGVNTVRSLAFSHDGKRLALGLTHRGILVVSVDDGRALGELAGHTEAVSAIAFCPDNTVLLTASWDRTIRTWRPSEIESPAGMDTLRGHSDHVMAVAFAPDGHTVASASRDGSLRLWDPDLAEPVARLTPVGGPGLVALAYAPDGRAIATAGAGPLVRVFKTDDATPSHELPGSPGGTAALAFDPSGRRLAAGGGDGDFRVWSLDSPGDSPLLVHAHTARVTSVAFDPTGTLIATGSRDHSVRLWNARTGELVGALPGHELDVFSVLFSADGTRLYSGSRDQTVRVWDVPSGTPIATLAGHGQYVTCLTLSPDGTRLAAGSWFGKVALFDTVTLDHIASFHAHDSAIRGVAFSPNGRWLASASYDGSVRLFDSATRHESEAARDGALAARASARQRMGFLLDQILADPHHAAGRLAQAGLDPATDPWIRKTMLSVLAPAKEEP